MMRWRPRLASVLFVVNLLIFLLPLGGIAVLRLYESELIRRTETELNAQGAFVASIYRTELLRSLSSGEAAGVVSSGLSNYGIALPPKPADPKDPDGPWTPIDALLDMAKDRIYPRAPDAREPEAPADPVAQLVGKRLTPVLLTAHRVTLSGIRVTDFRGVVVASTRGDLGKSLMGQEELRGAISGRHVSVLRARVGEGPSPPVESISRRSGVRVFVAMPVIERDRLVGAVLLSRTPLGLSQALHVNRSYLVGGGAVILLVVFAVTALTTLLITRPVKALIRQAEEVTLSHKAVVTVPLSSPGTHEVAQLSKALAQMSATQEKRADYIRTFASNVSHEFKTPLTSIRGTVELLKDHFADMSHEDRDRFLHILEQDADRLARLVGRLLDLAKADVVQPGAEQAPVPEVFDRVAHRFCCDGLNVTFNSPPQLPPVAMAPEVLESILSNLVDNARQHGSPAAHVHVSAHHETDAGKDQVEITVQDNGPGVSASDAHRIFTPFFTTARQSGGTGLGLSIVQALAVAHHGSITLEESPSGARFRIVLPVNPGHPAQRKKA
ncbi:MAG: HAMP domain-containing histidine kinase [Desulfomonile tiedjei]|nr:HAMP domain-containing histidine kinase [Desulfomonile tiedjei]